MIQRQFLLIFLSAAAILLLLVIGVYLLLHSGNSSTEGMMGGTPTTSSETLIAIILITIAIIFAVALALYFAYPKGKKRKHATEDESDFSCTLKQPIEKAVVPQESFKPFDVFLCYKKSSGKDYADHLKAGLEEIGLHTFEDCKDIPQTIDTQEGWASYRDRALTESKYFILIMTPGFQLSSEVVKEIKMARKQENKTFILFRYRTMGRQILVNLGDEVWDIGKLEQVSFDSKEELLRLAHDILLKQ